MRCWYIVLVYNTVYDSTGLKQFHKLTAECLANAIKKCLTCEDIKGKAAALPERLQFDGVKTVCNAVETYYASHVATGKFEEAVQARIDSAKSNRKQKLCGRK